MHSPDAHALLVRSVTTGCKINLFLRVVYKLDNGYHSLETLFVPLERPYDRLEFLPLPPGSGCDASPAVSVRFYELDEDRPTPPRLLPDIDPENNTLCKAYQWYKERSGFAPPLRITVYKGVPRGAGLGGGSANAAALLRYLQEQAESAGVAPLDAKTLLEGAAATGADVPFFLLNRPAFATGIGERLIPASHPYGGCYCVLACPDIAVSTAWAFSALDRMREGNEEKKQETASPRLTSGTHQATYTFACGEPLENDFEKPVFAAYPELARLKKRFFDLGAAVALMSGSGATIFGLFTAEAKAQAAAKTLANDGVAVYIQRLP